MSEADAAGVTAWSRRSRIGIFLVIGALTGLAPLSIDAYLPGLPDLTSDLGADPSTGQLTLTAFLIGLAVSQVVAGSISDTLGRRTPVLVGLLAYLVTSVLCGLSTGVLTLTVLRLAQGMAAGVGFVVARAIVRDLYTGSAMSRMYARLILVSGVAPVVAPIIGGQVLRFTSWRGIFVVFAAISALVLIAAELWLKETLPDDLRHEPGLAKKLHTFRELLWDRSFMPYALAGSLAFAAMFVYIAGSPFVLEDIHGLSPQDFSLAFAANALGLVLVSQLSGRLVERTGPGPLLQAGAAAMAVGSVATLAATALDAGLWPLLVGLWIAVSSIGLILPNSTALSLDRQGARAGSASALFGLGQFGIGALLAPLAGIAGKGTAVPMGIVIAACGLSTFAIARLYCRDDGRVGVALEPTP